MESVFFKSVKRKKLGGGGALKRNIAFPWIGALASSTSALYLFAYIKIDKDKKYMYIYMKICKQGVNK